MCNIYLLSKIDFVVRVNDTITWTFQSNQTVGPNILTNVVLFIFVKNILIIRLNLTFISITEAFDHVI